MGAPRLRQSVVVHRERYAPADDVAGIAAYDDMLRHFQENQGLPAIGWRMRSMMLNRQPAR
jgi:hypothetical protein